MLWHVFIIYANLLYVHC